MDSFFQPPPSPRETVVRAYADMGMVTIETEMPHDISRSRGKKDQIVVVASGAINSRQAGHLVAQLKRAIDEIGKARRASA